MGISSAGNFNVILLFTSFDEVYIYIIGNSSDSKVDECTFAASFW
jgi:hypothetical protein